MALSTAQVWEVRGSGSDSNGGGFKAGATGTDRSQQDAAQVVIDNATITTSIAANVITFTGYTPTSADVGNVVQMATGTNVTAGFYEITAQTPTTWTVTGAAALPTSGTTTNATGSMGGALQTLGKLSGAMVASNKAFIKSGTYGITTGVTFAQTCSPSRTVPPTELVGYNATRGDTVFGTGAANRPTIATNAASLTALTFSGTGVIVRNLIVATGSSIPQIGMLFSGGGHVCHNNKIANFSQYGVRVGGATGGVATYNEITGGVAATAALSTIFGAMGFSYNYIHDSAAVGIAGAGNGRIDGNVIANMSGASSDGIQTINSDAVTFNTIYNSGRHGIAITNAAYENLWIKGNVLHSNGGFGLTHITGAGVEARPDWDGNAFYNNTSGSRNNLDDTSTNPAHGVAPYTNTLDVPLASPNDPLTNAAGGDFTLNATSGRGALLRGTAPGAALPGLTQAGYRDFGAFQSQPSGLTPAMFRVSPARLVTRIVEVPRRRTVVIPGAATPVQVLLPTIRRTAYPRFPGGPRPRREALIPAPAVVQSVVIKSTRPVR
jgi:hypothetical protein